MSHVKSKNRGAIALTATIILAAVIVTMSLSLLLVGISNRSNIFHALQSEITFIKNDGCAEEALIQLNRDNNYPGNSYAVDDLDCTVLVTGSENQRTLSVEGNEGEYYHVFSINVQLIPTFDILDWEEQ